ncbi:MAG: ABC transporter substrate-binding protein [Gammaproteobacteria bacterium]
MRAVMRLLALGLALLCAPASALDVAVVVSQREGVHKAFADAFKRAAASLGHRVFDIGSPAEGLDDVALARADLVVASGEAAAELALARHVRPTLVTMIARSRFEALRKAHPQAPLSAWLLDQPLERQLRLLRAVLPERKRVGLLLGANADAEARLHGVAADFGLSLATRVVRNDKEVIASLEEVLSASEVLLALPDPMLTSPTAARSILLTSYRYQKPIIAFSRAYVTAGALAAVFITPEQVAGDLIDWLRSQNGKPLVLPPPRDPVSFEIAVNRQVARALGINVADDGELLRLTAEGGQP